MIPRICSRPLHNFSKFTPVRLNQFKQPGFNAYQLNQFTTQPSQPQKNGGSSSSSRSFLYIFGTAFLGVSAYYYYISSRDPIDDGGPVLSQEEFIPLTLTSITPVNHNTSIFRLKLPSPFPRPFPVASFVLTKNPLMQIVRPYTPVSKSDERKFIDLMIKRYDTGEMSRYIHSLKVGDKLEVKGPMVKLEYKENMKKDLGMIAGGTGITPMYQVINHVLSLPKDTTKIHLIYANITKDDILLHAELESLANKYPDRLKIYYTLDKPPADGSWNQGVGYVSAEMVKQNIPPPSDDVLVLICGPNPMLNHVSGPKGKKFTQGEVGGVLKALGYTENQVFKF